MQNKCCGNCLWFNGETGDDMQFCDEREVYVREDGYCYRYTRKEWEEE